MKTRVFTITAVALLAGLTILSSCNKDDDDDNNNNPPADFVADDNTFQDFKNWPLEATAQGPDPALGPAHGGNDSTVVRNIYFKSGQDPVNGVYPLGSIIVKQSTKPDGSMNEITAMVKRGTAFAPASNNWEYFMLAPDGSIADDGMGGKMRGANLMNGMCLGCHTAATTDYIFSKQ